MTGSTGKSPWLGMVLPLQNGWWEVLGKALGSQEQRLQVRLRGSDLLFLVAIKACGSGCLSGRIGYKHEKTGRGVTALETPKEAEDGGQYQSYSRQQYELLCPVTRAAFGISSSLGLYKKQKLLLFSRSIAKVCSLLSACTWPCQGK